MSIFPNNYHNTDQIITKITVEISETLSINPYKSSTKYYVLSLLPILTSFFLKGLYMKGVLQNQ